MPSYSRVIVVGPDSDRVRWYTQRRDAARMVIRGQAFWDGNARVRLRPGSIAVSGVYHPMRTRTCRGEYMAAIGQGQEYTVRGERNAVTGFKFIHPEDRGYFQTFVAPPDA